MNGLNNKLQNPNVKEMSKDLMSKDLLFELWVLFELWHLSLKGDLKFC
ncbi:MAG: hypothetical protein HY776_02880 [Actinobacteria bacterium]|nr:hypothetical protein [Actinomycetota bacterium]